MTKLRKLTALLLAGALALLLLTACGGGGSSSPEAQAEANVMRAINDGRSVALANDPGMQKVANDCLDNLDTELKGSALGYKYYNRVIADRANSTLTVIAKYDYKDTSLDRLIGYITNDNPISNLKFSQSGNWTSVGVVARTVQGQTYIAISLRVNT